MILGSMSLRNVPRKGLRQLLFKNLTCLFNAVFSLTHIAFYLHFTGGVHCIFNIRMLINDSFCKIIWLMKKICQKFLSYSCPNFIPFTQKYTNIILCPWMITTFVQPSNLTSIFFVNEALWCSFPSTLQRYFYFWLLLWKYYSNYYDQFPPFFQSSLSKKHNFQRNTKLTRLSCQNSYYLYCYLFCCFIVVLDDCYVIVLCIICILAAIIFETHLDP